MQVRLLGYQGAMNRLQELRARAEELRPSEPEAAFPDAATSHTGLSGTIGGGGSAKPLNPFGPGVSVEGLSSPGQLKPMIDKAAAQAGLDPSLLDALVSAESSYNPLARSSAGAMGLTQLMPGTAKSLGVTNPFDPYQNLTGGANYLSQMIKKYNGDIGLALAAYNAGPNAVDRHGGIPPYSETRNYVQKILATYEARKQP